MENEVVENIVTDSVTENSGDVNSSDDISLFYDYYDRYYEEVLSDFDESLKNQNTIIINQEKIIEKNERISLGIDVLVFLIGVFIIYYYLRKMIIVK